MAAQLQEGNDRRKRRIEETSASPELRTLFCSVLRVLLMGRRMV